MTVDPMAGVLVGLALVALLVLSALAWRGRR